MDKKPNNVFNLKLINEKIKVTQPKISASDNLNPISVTQKANGFSLRSVAHKEFDLFYEKFKSNLLMLNLTQKTESQIYKLCEDLVTNLQSLNEKTTNKENTSSAFKYVVDKLHSDNTHPKRLKKLEEKPNYVAPQETAIGLKWKTYVNPSISVPDHKIVQTTYYYVPIIETIKSQFSNSEFFNAYLKFNDNKSHVCSKGVFVDFCCGTNAKSHHIYKEKRTIHIQIGIDDFDPCDALKSKAGAHKQCAIYFQVRNLPAFLKSKLSNIYVVAVVPTIEFKHDNHVIDEVIKKVVDELKILESEGIAINGITIKGGLIGVSGDNLGSNIILFCCCFAFIQH